MLVINRRCSQRILIGDNVVITVVGVDCGRVKIGITAPRSILVNRDDHLPEDELEILIREIERGDYDEIDEVQSTRKDPRNSITPVVSVVNPLRQQMIDCGLVKPVGVVPSEHDEAG